MSTSTEALGIQNEGGDDHIPRHKSTVRSAFAQVLAIFIQDWLIICNGLAASISTLVIGSLHRNSSETFSLNDSQASWFGGLPSVFHLVGSLATGPVQERFGRKGSMVLVNIPYFASWVTLYFANSVYALYAAAVIQGICVGLSEAPLHSYVGEIAEPHLRGTLSSLSSSAHILGMFIMYFMGYLLDWRTAALISGCVSVVTFVTMTQIPESPAWLIIRKRHGDAEKSLCWLRGWVDPKEVKEELQNLVKYTTERVDSSTVDCPDNKEGERDITDDHPKLFQGITKKNILIPLRMVCIVITISYSAALAGFKPYQIRVLKELGLQDTGKLLLVVGEVALFLGAMANILCLRFCGKRNIAFFGYGIATATGFGLAFYSAFMIPAHPSNLVWIPLILTQILKFCIGLSIFLLPFQLLCEVFPPVGRGAATGIVTAWGQIVNFIMIKSLLYLEAWLTLSGVFFFYSACTAVGVIYLYFYLPETEGKTLEEIESYFTNNCNQKEKYSVKRSN